MRICPFNFNIQNNINFTQRRSSLTSPFLHSRACDVFEKQETKVIKEKSDMPFCASKWLSVYRLFPKAFKDIKYDRISDDCKDVAKKSIQAARIMKKFLDKKYGEDGYVFVSIGTSPAGVAKSLELMGEDVRYMPISGIRKIGFPYQDLPLYQDTEKYGEFLDSIGLNSENINNGDKKYLFYDYTSTGKTLDAVEYFAKYYRGISGKKAKFRSLNNDILQACKKEKNKPMEELMGIYVSDYLQHSKINKYAGIPHVQCLFVDGIEDALKTTLTSDEKDFNFALMYLLERRNLLK